MAAHGLGTTGRHVEHIPLTDEVLGTFAIKNNAAIESGGNLEGDAGGNVGFDHAGDYVRTRRLCGDDEMDACGACHLCDASDGNFNVRRSGLHQVGEFIDDDDDVGHRVGNDDLLLTRRRCLRIPQPSATGIAKFGVTVNSAYFGGFGCAVRHGSFLGKGSGDACIIHSGFDRRRCCGIAGCTGSVGFSLALAIAIVEGFKVAAAFLSEDLIAVLHLLHHPAQREQCFLGISDDRQSEMRQFLVILHFHDLRIDHDETQFVWSKTTEQTGDDAVDADRFTTASGTSDEQMRHCGEITNDRLAIHVFTKSDGQLGFAVYKSFVFQ